MGFIDSIKNFASGFVNKSYDAPPNYSEGLIVEKGWEELQSNTVLVTANGGPGTLAPTVNVNQCLNRYRSWVYPCVDIISKTIPTIPYYLYKEIGQPGDEEFEKVQDHPLIRLLNKPNKFLPPQMFWNIIAKHLDLTGMAFARILFNGVGQPAELHIMPPHELVHIEYGNNTDEIIKKFVFNSERDRFKKIDLYWEEVLYFWYPHPKHIFLPYSPMQSLAHIVDLAMYMEVYEKDFFQNNARPDFVILMENGGGREVAERIQKGWDNKYRGPGKQHRPAVLGPNVKIETLGIPAKDFEFAGTANFTQDHILAHFHVPKAKLGIVDGTSKQGIIATDTVFAQECIAPRLNIIAGVVNTQLLPSYRNPDGLVFKYDSPLPKDEEWQLTKNQGELTVGLTTHNEIRKRNGQKPWKSPLADVPWINGVPLAGENEEADKLFQKQSSGGAALAGGMGIPGQEEVPTATTNDPMAQGEFGSTGGRPEGSMLSSMLGEALRSSRPSLSSLLNASRGKRGGLSSLLQSHPELISFNSLIKNERYGNTGLTKLLTRGIEDYIYSTLDEEDKIVFKSYEDAIAQLDLVEDDYHNNARDFFVEKGIQIAEIVEKSFSDFITKGSEEFDIDEGTVRDDYKKSAEFFIKKACEIGYYTGFELVKKAKDIRDPMPAEKAAIEAAGKTLDKSADLKVKSTKRDLTKIIKRGLSEGLDSEKVAEMIQSEFKEIGYSRASRIARSELASAWWAGMDASYEQINKEAGKTIVKKSIFWTSLDERVCKECKEDFKKIVKNYETGEVSIEDPPHPNCRCLPRPEYE